MVSKECFVGIMEGVEAHYRLLNNLMKSEIISADSKLFNIIDSVVDALSEELEVEPSDYSVRCSWEPVLHTYCYSLDFGKDYTSHDWIVKINDVEYKPTSFEELYDVIMKIYHEQE